uniref:Putative secreted protein n=1 Tax=Ixodes ricinus TaxID=34613 RepID=A0A6B0U5M6_IXORI
MFRTWFLMPWCRMEFLLVLQMIKSAHCTMTMETKKAVWQVYSRVLRFLYVHSWPYESMRSLTALESQCLRRPSSLLGQKPLSPMMTK